MTEGPSCILFLVKTMARPDVFKIAACLLLITGFINGQNPGIEIIDNVAQMNMEQRYIFSNDSLIITGVSDYGRTRIVYLQRKLENKELRYLKKFIRTFPAEKLKDEYFDDYSNFKVISDENYPRSITLKIHKNGKEYVSKSTNVYVVDYQKLFRSLNPMIPDEVRIRYEKSNLKEIKQK